MSLNLAPDIATADRAKKLVNPAFWRNLAGNPELIWGECKSSGLTYYKVAFHKANQSFKCNCASRKYPCKHAIALSVLLADQADMFKVNQTTPSWITDWLEQGASISKVSVPEAEQAKAARAQDEQSGNLGQ